MLLRWLKCVFFFFFFFFLVSWDWVRLSALATSATNWSIVTAPDDRWWVWSSRWNENWQGKPKYLEKTCPSATLSTTNPTYPDPRWNPDTALGRYRLTAWAMARQKCGYSENYFIAEFRNVFCSRVSCIKKLSASNLELRTGNPRMHFIIFFGVCVQMASWSLLLKTFSATICHPS
jgi:hypothetical protein